MQLEKVHDRLAFGSASGLRELVNLFGIGPTLIGDHENVMMRGRDEQLGDEIVVVRGLCARDAAPAALLRAIGSGRAALDITLMRHGDDHVFLDDHLLDRDVIDLVSDDFGAAIVPKSLRTSFELCEITLENFYRNPEMVEISPMST